MGLLVWLLLGAFVLVLPVGAAQAQEGGSSTVGAVLGLGGLDNLRLGKIPLLGGNGGASDGLDDLASDPSSSPPSANASTDASAGTGQDEALAPHAQPAPATAPSGESDQGNGWMAWLLAVPLTVIGLGSVLVAKHRGALGQSKQPAAGQAAGAATGQATASPAVAVPDEVAAAGQGAKATKRPPAGVGGVLALGRQAVQAGDTQDAVTWFETAIAVQPRLPVAHFCLGLCLYEEACYEQAAEAFAHAAELDPSNPAAAFNHARALCQGGRFEAAMASLDTVLQAYPGMVDRIREDEAFQGLRDHPSYLARLGEL